MLHMWSVVFPSLLNYPHAYLIAVAHYLLVVLVDTKELKRQHRKLSEPANACKCLD